MRHNCHFWIFLRHKELCRGGHELPTSSIRQVTHLINLKTALRLCQWCDPGSTVAAVLVPQCTLTAGQPIRWVWDHYILPKLWQIECLTGVYLVYYSHQKKAKKRKSGQLEKASPFLSFLQIQSKVNFNPYQLLNRLIYYLSHQSLIIRMARDALQEERNCCIFNCSPLLCGQSCSWSWWK